MGKNNSKVAQDVKKSTTRRLKVGVKFGKDQEGGVEAGLMCGYEKKVDKVFGPPPPPTETSVETRLQPNESEQVENG